MLDGSRPWVANHLECAHRVADIDTSFSAREVFLHCGSLRSDIIEVALVVEVPELSRWKGNRSVTLAVLDTAIIAQVNVMAVIDKVEER